jgi:PIN like domain
MRFFVDRNIRIYLAKMLAAYSEHEVKHHDQDERFQLTTPDEEWIRTLAKDSPSWVVLTADMAILDRPPERKALEEANFTLFGFDKQWLKLSFPEQAWRLVKAWPAIIQKAEARVDRPTIFKVRWGKSQEIEELGQTRARGRRGG